MAINYAEKYSSKIDERFKLNSLTGSAVNTDYDFVGVSTVYVYGMDTPTLNDYTSSGTNRYGSPAELGNTKQELTLAQDKSFTFTIDRRNYTDTQMTVEAGSSLQRTVDEVIIPHIDQYRISKMVAGAGTSKVLAITKSNAYEAFLDGQNALLEAKVPLENRVAFVSPAYFKNIKLDASFIQAGDVAQNMLVRGSLGMIDGVNIVPVPTTYLTAAVDFVITHRVATTAAQKISDYKTHDNPPGINGWLVEGRVYFDAFVLNNKKNAIYVNRNTAAVSG